MVYGNCFRALVIFLCSLTVISLAAGQAAPPAKPRARDLGVPFDGTPGPLNRSRCFRRDRRAYHAHFRRRKTASRQGAGSNRRHRGSFRAGKDSMSQSSVCRLVVAERQRRMTGTTWVEESGFLEGPVMITNTHSVGVVRDAVIQWRVNHGQPDPTGYWWSLPVVAETWDGWLNDINGFM